MTDSEWTEHAKIIMHGYELGMISHREANDLLWLLDESGEWYDNLTTDRYKGE